MLPLLSKFEKTTRKVHDDDDSAKAFAKSGRKKRRKTKYRSSIVPPIE